MQEEVRREILNMFESLSPNKVVQLSPEAGTELKRVIELFENNPHYYESYKENQDFEKDS